MIQIFAHSSAGEGEPAYVEIWTPEILPCGSDKDPGKIAGIVQDVFFLGGGEVAQWLSGRVIDSRPRGRRFEPHRRHCVVSLS